MALRLWLGFPKSLDISKAIDKKAGVEREVIGTYKTPDGRDYTLEQSCQKGYNKTDLSMGRDKGVERRMITSPTTDLAKQWNGWGTALKPANEPIVLARKPISEKTVAENVLKWGTGGLNIDGCRIPAGENELKPTVRGAGVHKIGNERLTGWNRDEYDGTYTPNEAGRFPANVILDEEAGRMLDAQQEGASRFFYVAKASRSERTHGGKVENNHPTVKPIQLMRYLCRLIAPPGGLILDPFAGSGTTLIAAIEEGFSVIGIEREPEYCEIIRQRMQEAVRVALPMDA